MPDACAATLAARLRLVEGRLIEAARAMAYASPSRAGGAEVRDALAELRALQRAVGEQPTLAGAVLAHGSQP